MARSGSFWRDFMLSGKDSDTLREEERARRMGSVIKSPSTPAPGSSTVVTSSKGLWLPPKSDPPWKVEPFIRSKPLTDPATFKDLWETKPVMDSPGRTEFIRPEDFKELDAMVKDAFKSPAAAADPARIKLWRKSIVYIKTQGEALLDGGLEFTYDEKLARALMRIPEARVDDPVEAERHVREWSEAHHRALTSVFRNRESFAFALDTARALEAKTDKIRGREATGIVFDEVADIERQMKPRSEHSPEKALEEALERETLVSDPDYGSW